MNLRSSSNDHLPWNCYLGLRRHRPNWWRVIFYSPAPIPGGQLPIQVHCIVIQMYNLDECCKADVIVWPKFIIQLLPGQALGWQLLSNIEPPKQPCLLSPTRGGKGNARLDSLAIYHRCSHLLETVYKLHPLRCRLYADYCIY